MSTNRSHLLVVDDDRRLRQLLLKYLSDNGFLVTTAKDTSDARKKMTTHLFDLIILDVMMPGESGLDFISAARESPLNPVAQIPILLLTAMGDADDRIKGLEKGADDYLSKPFEPKELLLRIQTILRRLKPRTNVQNQVSLGVHHFDIDRATLYHDKTPLPLTTVESNLLKILALNPGQTLSRDELARRSGVELSPRTVDVQVTRLRRKIETNPRQPIYLKTVRHKGYVLWPD